MNIDNNYEPPWFENYSALKKQFVLRYLIDKDLGDGDEDAVQKDIEAFFTDEQYDSEETWGNLKKHDYCEFSHWWMEENQKHPTNQQIQNLIQKSTSALCDDVASELVELTLQSDSKNIMTHEKKNSAAEKDFNKRTPIPTNEIELEEEEEDTIIKVQEEI